MIFSQSKCEKCAHRQGNNCALSNAPIVDLNASCPHYTESAYICELCGKHLFKEAVNYTYGTQQSHHLICLTCYSSLFTCQTCLNANICSFRTDSSIQEPPLVVQTIQQGNTRVQAQIKNPARIKLTCEKCDCYHGEECCKETINRCDKFQNCITGW